VNIMHRASAKEAHQPSVTEQISTTEEDIRARAYEIWEDEGRPEGKHLEHWGRAKDEVVAPEMTAPRSNGAKSPARGAAKSPVRRVAKAKGDAVRSGLTSSR
jgi:hypothetical protein